MHLVLILTLVPAVLEPVVLPNSVLKDRYQPHELFNIKLVIPKIENIVDLTRKVNIYGWLNNFGLINQRLSNETEEVLEVI